MIVLGILQLFFIIAITYYEYRNKSPIVFLWATLLVMFGVMHVVSYLLPSYKYADSLDEASIFVILFCFIYYICRVIFRRFVTPLKNIGEINTLEEDRIMFAGKILLFFAVSLYGYFVVKSSGSLILVTKENVYRTMAKESKVFLFSTYLYYATIPLWLYCLLRKRKKDAIFIAGLILCRTLMSSARMDAIILFSGAIAYIIINPSSNKIRNAFKLAFIGLVAIFLVYALRTFRYYYTFSDIGDIKISVFFQHMTDFLKNDDGELGLRSVFYYFIRNNNQFEGFGTGNGYKRLLLMIIPSRFLQGIKPEDMCVVMGRAWRPYFSGIINYTVTPTLFGDCYANFGFWGFLLGGVWAFIGTIMDAIANRKNEIIRIMMWCLIATEFIDIGRGSVYNPICYIWYCGILIAFLNFAKHFRFGNLKIVL